MALKTGTDIKVLNICSWYPNRLVKYDGNFIFRHIRSTVGKVYSYAIAVYEDENLTGKTYEIVESEEDGVKSMVIYHSASCCKLIKLLKRFYFYLKAYRIFRTKYGKPDIIHAHVMLYAGVFTWLLSCFTRIPYVVTEHSSVYITEKLNFFLLKALQFVAARSIAVLPVSEALSKRMKELGVKGNHIVTANVVDTGIYKPSEKPSIRETIRILHISNFSEAKNMPGIADVIRKLSSIRQDFVFTIAGDGDLTIVENLLKNSGVDNELFDLKSELTEKEVAELMQENDIFMLFSKNENLPCVLIEAQACGMPIAATDVGGVREIVLGNEFGGLVKSGDANSMVKALSEMMDNLDNYDKQWISENAKRKYSNEAIGQMLLSVYRECP